MRDHKVIPKWLNEIRSTHNSYQFNIDHPFKIDGTKSYVFYPYVFEIKQIEPFRIYLESKGYEIFIDTYSEYGAGTFKIILKHIDDRFEELSKGLKRIKEYCDKYN